MWQSELRKLGFYGFCSWLWAGSSYPSAFPGFRCVVSNWLSGGSGVRISVVAT